MAAKTNVQTNLLGKRVNLSAENTQAAIRYADACPETDLPWLKLHPEGGEVVAVFTDRDGELNITASTQAGDLVTLPVGWLKLSPRKSGL
jgi:hypothetical protein